MCWKNRWKGAFKITKEISGMSLEELKAEVSLTAEEIQNMEPEEIRSIGKYGRMAMDYMKSTDPGRLNHLIPSGQHREIFMEADKAAYNRMDEIEAQLRSQEPRSTNGDYLELVQYENRIRGIAEEIVLTEIVYQRR